MYIVTIYTGTFDNFFIYDDKYPSPFRAADIFLYSYLLLYIYSLRGIIGGADSSASPSCFLTKTIHPLSR